jgi:hypothetical protein
MAWCRPVSQGADDDAAVQRQLGNHAGPPARGGFVLASVGCVRPDRVRASLPPKVNWSSSSALW